MNKTFISFILFVGGLLVFHYGIFPIFMPKEPTLFLNRYVCFLLMAAYLIIVNLTLRLKPPISLNALMVWCLGFRITSYNVCYTKLLRYIEQAFRAEAGLTLGPSTDGGYYLIGMAGRLAEVFA